MIKPYVHVICEKVITDKSDMVSLIGLFNKLSINVPQDVSEIPDNSIAPKEWTIFSSWDVEESDAEIEYSICTEIFYPNKKQFGETNRTSLVSGPKKRRRQAIVLIPAFPIGQQGSYTVRTWIEHNGAVVVEPLEISIEVELVKAT